jgi:hypothetical protein
MILGTAAIVFGAAWALMPPEESPRPGQWDAYQSIVDVSVPDLMTSFVAMQQSQQGDAAFEVIANWRRAALINGNDMIHGMDFQDAMDALEQFNNQINHMFPSHGFGAVGALFAGYDDPANSSLICAATMLSSRVVVTARHCQYEDHPEIDYWFYNQYTGLHKIAEDKDGEDDFRVDPDEPHRDLALAVLEEPVVGVDPYAIGSTRPHTGTDGYLLGFGITHNEGGDRGVKRRGHILTADCPDLIQTEFFCFTNPDSNPEVQSHCNFDSGGPMLTVEDDQFVVIGVASNSHWLCNGTGSYTSAVTDNAREWIAGELAATDSEWTPERTVLEVVDSEFADEAATPEQGTVSAANNVQGSIANLNYAQTPSDPAALQLNDFHLGISGECTSIANFIVSCALDSIPADWEISREIGFGNYQFIVSADVVPNSPLRSDSPFGTSETAPRARDPIEPTPEAN